MHRIVRESIPAHDTSLLTSLGGPSFAREVAESKPTAVVVAGDHADVVHDVQSALTTPSFRVYTSQDLVGVEVGGALKNVIAIAVGVCDGLGLGLNARAALITRGLAEMTRLAVALGANPLTLAGPQRRGGLGADVHRRSV